MLTVAESFKSLLEIAQATTDGMKSLHRPKRGVTRMPDCHTFPRSLSPWRSCKADGIWVVAKGELKVEDASPRNTASASSPCQTGHAEEEALRLVWYTNLIDMLV